MKFTTLIDAQRLAEHLHNPAWVIFDCRFTLTDAEAGQNAYALAHIPGARYVHLNHDLAGPVTATSGRHPLPDPATLAQKLGAWGVDADKQVVVYDDSFGAIATRMWWMLRWLGHDAVALLDGGLPKWRRLGYETTVQVTEINSCDFIAQPRRELWVDTAQVQEALSSKVPLLDARAEIRFTGDREPLDKVAGHIPGSYNRPFEDNLGPAGDFLGAEELRESYEETLNGEIPMRSIHLCGSGVTACHNLLAMEIAGISGGKLYPGSWSEWITDASRPVAVGEVGDQACA